MVFEPARKGAIRVTIPEAHAEFARLKTLDKPFFAPRDVFRLLGVASYSINLTAYEDPKSLGYPVMLSGRRVRIPRAAFLEYVRRDVLGDPEHVQEPPEAS